MKTTWTICLVVGLVGCGAPQTTDSQESALAAAVDDVPFSWLPSSGKPVAPIDGTNTHLVRNHGEGGQVVFSGTTSGLPAGHAVTVGLLVFNHPESCKGIPAYGIRCSPGEIGNPAVQGSVLHISGAVVGDDGTLSFDGGFVDGDGSACYAGLPCHNGIQNAYTADVHFGIRDHGPALADTTAQTSTWNGGCPPNKCVMLQGAPHQ